MKVGVALPHFGSPDSDASIERVVDVAKECERLRFDSVWVADHLVFDMAKYGGTPDPIGSLEPLTTLAVLAAETKSVRLGTMVLCNEFRHPFQLAKEAATIDQASDGRLELGLGAGWYEPEFRQGGIDFPPARVRLERLCESVEILKALFAGEPVTYAGRHYQLTDALARPRPAQSPRPTIWMGVKGDRAIRLAGKIADGWNTAWFQEADDYRERAAYLGDSAVKRSIGQYAEGTAQQMTDRLASFAESGVEHAVMCFSRFPFGLDDPDDLVRFGQDVLPHVREF